MASLSRRHLSIACDRRPGVAFATLTSHLPMGEDGSNNTRGFSIPGYVPAKGEGGRWDLITDFEGPGFFRIMGIGVGGAARSKRATTPHPQQSA